MCPYNNAACYYEHCIACMHEDSDWYGGQLDCRNCMLPNCLFKKCRQNRNEKEGRPRTDKSDLYYHVDSRSLEEHRLLH
jgi:hypothetical protein